MPGNVGDTPTNRAGLSKRERYWYGSLEKEGHAWIALGQQ